MKLHNRLVFALVSKRAWPRELVEGPYFQALARRRSFRLVLLLCALTILFPYCIGRSGMFLHSPILIGVVSALCVAWCARLQHRAIPLSELRVSALSERDIFFFPAVCLLQAFTISIFIGALFPIAAYSQLIVGSVLPPAQRIYYIMFIVSHLLGWFIAQRFCEFSALRTLDLAREKDYFWRPMIGILFSMPTLLYLCVRFASVRFWIWKPFSNWPLFDYHLLVAAFLCYLHFYVRRYSEQLQAQAAERLGEEAIV